MGFVSRGVSYPGELVVYPNTQSNMRILTVIQRSHYIHRMSKSEEQPFSQELARLEKRLDELVVICSQLKEENQSLKNRQDTLIADRATLLQKNEQVRARVEAMINRLKAMESSS
jgi:cell division protein ZapB